jgi:hypothetical protein
MTSAVSFSQALFALAAGLAYVLVLGVVVCLLVAAVDAVLGELIQIFGRRRASAPARETVSAPSVSRALTELGAELDRVAWPWTTSTADAGQASAVENRRPSEEEALWTRA